MRNRKSRRARLAAEREAVRLTGDRHALIVTLQARRRMNEVGTLWFALAVCVFGTVRATRNIYWGRQSAGWPVVEAKVIQCYLRGGFGLPFSPVVRYSYEFRGDRFRRSRIAFVYLQIRSRAAANAFLSQFQPSAQLAIRVHPTRPGVSVIRPGNRAQNWVELTAGILVAYFVLSRLIENLR